MIPSVSSNPHSAAQSRKKDSSFVLLFFSAGLLLILIILLKIPYSLFCIAFSFFATTHLFYSLFSELTSSCCLILATPLLFRFIMLISTIWVFQNIYLKKQKSLKLLRCKDYKIVQKLIGTCGMWVLRLFMIIFLKKSRNPTLIRWLQSIIIRINRLEIWVGIVRFLFDNKS